MILLQPMVHTRHDTGSVTRVTIKSMGVHEKANFSKEISSVRREPLFLLHSCEDKYNYYKDGVISLMHKRFTNKGVTRHTADKPWVSDYFRCLIRKRQRAFMSGDHCENKALRNETNRASARLKLEFYQNQSLAITDSGSRDWWKNMKKIMGLDGNSKSCIEQLANKNTNGDCTELANKMNDFLMSVSEHLPRLDTRHAIFTVNCLMHTVLV